MLKRLVALVLLLLTAMTLCAGCSNDSSKIKEYVPVKGFDALIENCKKAIETKDTSLVPDELRYIFISDENDPEYYGYTTIDFDTEQVLAIYRSYSLYDFNVKNASLCHLYRLDEEGYLKEVKLCGWDAGEESETNYSHRFIYADSYPDTLFLMLGCFSYNDECEDDISLFASLDDYNASQSTAKYEDWDISFSSGESVIDTDDGEVTLREADFELEEFVTPDKKSVTPSLYFGDKFDITGYWQIKGKEYTWYHFIDDRYYEIIYEMNDNEVYITDPISYEFFKGTFYVEYYEFEVTEEGYLLEDRYFDSTTCIPVDEPVFDVEFKPYSEYLNDFEDWLNS